MGQPVLPPTRSVSGQTLPLLQGVRAPSPAVGHVVHVGCLPRLSHIQGPVGPDVGPDTPLLVKGPPDIPPLQSPVPDAVEDDVGVVPGGEEVRPEDNVEETHVDA